MGGAYYDYSTGETYLENINFMNNTSDGTAGDIQSNLVQYSHYKNVNFTNSKAHSAG